MSSIAEIASNLVAIAQSLLSDSHGSIVRQTGFRIELEILSQLPKDTGFGDDGATVGDRIEHVKEEYSKSMEEDARVIELISSSSPEVLDQYFSLWQNDGYMVANSWLLEP